MHHPQAWSSRLPSVSEPLQAGLWQAGASLIHPHPFFFFSSLATPWHMEFLGHELQLQPMPKLRQGRILPAGGQTCIPVLQRLRQCHCVTAGIPTPLQQEFLYPYPFIFALWLQQLPEGSGSPCCEGGKELLGLFGCFKNFFLCRPRATPVAYGGSQARDGIGAADAGLHHSHNHARSEPCLQSTPQLTAMPDSQPTERGQGTNLHPRGYESHSSPLSHEGKSGRKELESSGQGLSAFEPEGTPGKGAGWGKGLAVGVCSGCSDQREAGGGLGAMLGVAGSQSSVSGCGMDSASPGMVPPPRPCPLPTPGEQADTHSGRSRGAGGCRVSISASSGRTVGTGGR